MLAVYAALSSAVRLAAAQSDNPLDNVLDSDASYFTTNFGLPVSSDNASLTVGARGTQPRLVQHSICYPQHLDSVRTAAQHKASKKTQLTESACYDLYKSQCTMIPLIGKP